MTKKIYLIDGNSFIYRMFFALPEFATKDGRIVNATYWMAKFLTSQLTKENPDYVVFIKDAKWKNFRHDLYSEYKATRERMPDSLRSQIGDIEELLHVLEMKVIEIAWYEADDVIWTLASQLWQDENHEIYILSGDKDLYALVNNQVKVYDTQRKKISWLEETFEKFGVPADCVRDYLAICWDTSDNIPGISGIWPKKAQVLLNFFWSLENIYKWIEDIESSFDSFPIDVQKLLKGKTLDKFIEGKELAFLSQKLATLDCSMDLSDFDLEDYQFDWFETQSPSLQEFFKEYEFHSLMTESVIELKTWKDVWLKVQLIWDLQGLQDLESKISHYKCITFDTETTSLNVREAELVWVSILLDEANIYYINLLHRWACVEYNHVQEFILNLFKQDIEIVWHNLKYDLQVIERFLSKDSVNNTPKEGLWNWQMTLEL
jgi:DNA polymerase-1